MDQTTALLSIFISIVLLNQSLPAIATSASISPSVQDSSEVAGITVTVSQSGLQYAKEVALKSLLPETTPFRLPDVQTQVKSPLGRVEAQLSHVELARANVSFADVNLGNSGVTVVARDLDAKVRFHWAYQFSAEYVPFPAGDQGWAEVQVLGMQAGVTFSLVALNGTLRLRVVECGAHIDDLEIEVEGRASWLYQLLVRTFKDEIRAAIEAAVLKRILVSTENLDQSLQALPRSLPIDGILAVDVTIMQDPLVSPSTLSVAVRGEFFSQRKLLSTFKKQLIAAPVILTTSMSDTPMEDNFVTNRRGQLQGTCKDSTKMVAIILRDYMVNSAAKVYYEAGLLEWLVDELPQEAWLNTRFWRWIVPQLYRKYPNMDMALAFACSAAPSVHMQRDGIVVNIAANVILLVKLEGGSKPVACVSLVSSMDAVVNVVGNNIMGEAKLDDLKLELSWSTVGRFPVNLLQPMLRTIISTVLLPILNEKLVKGFPLPVLPIANLQNVDIQYEEDFVFICSDVYYKRDKNK